MQESELLHASFLAYLQARGLSRIPDTMSAMTLLVLNHLSDSCSKPGNVTEEDYAVAESVITRFDLCFVTEWLTESAVLLKYTLGMQVGDNTHPTNPM